MDKAAAGLLSNREIEDAIVGRFEREMMREQLEEQLAQEPLPTDAS